MTDDITALYTKLECLRQEQAIFCLKALLVAGHISNHTLLQAINLAETMPND